MAVVNYKTQNDTTPQGKPRVYFCCHPEDFDKYFETISKEILEKQNYAVWYAANVYTERDREFLSSLAQMQLFVMPITRNLLCSDNAALDVEFQFAIENHIPVLPLLQESGLENLFNQKCGDLQFLDKTNQDITAIGYHEKLEKYLNAVLIGDELAEKIRAAFDAYIFLSYRKKDRKYAQELIRLIHQNEFCRDIAIWYDEFLIPGENFNDSIKEALQKSHLFVLAVTPNLVNETNYIMTTEYPIAKQAGKPILPAELVPTDRVQLSEKYKDIPTCFNAHNEEEFSKVLFDSIKKAAIKETVDSPEHNFLIGLAYLGGVDVEVNYERALSLITAAAEAGLTDAVDKLFDMYLNGIGVKRDLNKALDWKKYKSALFRDRFLKNKTNETLVHMFSALEELCDFYIHIQNDRADAFHLYLQFEKDFSDFILHLDTLESQKILGRLYMYIGDAYTDIGELHLAERYLNKAEKISAQLTSRAKENLLNNFESVTLGDVKNLWSIHCNLALIYDSLGILFQTQGEKESCEKYFLKAFELRQEASKHIKNSRTLNYGLLVSYLHLADYYVQADAYAEAKKYLEPGVSLTTALADSTKDLYMGEMCVRLLNLEASVFCKCAQYKTAQDIYTICISSLEASEKTPMTIHLLVQNYIYLADVLLQDHAVAEAHKYLSKAHDWMGKAKISDSNLYRELQDVQRKFDCQPEIIQARVTLCQKQLQEISDKESSDKTILETTRILMELADAWFDCENYKGVEKECLLGLMLCKQISSFTNDPDMKEQTILHTYWFNKKLASVYLKQGKVRKAEKYIKRLAKTAAKGLKNTGNYASSRFLAIAYRDIGNFYNKQNRIGRAKKYYEKAIMLIETVLQADSKEENIKFAANLYYDFAVLDQKHINLQLLESAQKLWTRLVCMFPDNKEYQKSAESVNKWLNQ